MGSTQDREPDTLSAAPVPTICDESLISNPPLKDGDCKTILSFCEFNGTRKQTVEFKNRYCTVIFIPQLSL